MKRRYLYYGLGLWALTLVLLISIVMPPISQAFNPDPGCNFPLFGVCDFKGWYGGQDWIDTFNTNRRDNWTWPTPQNGIDSVAKLMARFNIDINRTMMFCDPSMQATWRSNIKLTPAEAAQEAKCNNNAELIGTSYIINTMLGFTPAQTASIHPWCTTSLANRVKCGIENAKNNLATLGTIIQKYQDAGQIEWNQKRSYSDGEHRADTMVIDSTTDVGAYDNGNAQTDRYIVFHNPDGTEYAINKTCGNVTGPSKSLALIGFHVQPWADQPALIPANGIPTSATFTGHVSVSNGPVKSTAHRWYYIKHANNTETPHVLGGSAPFPNVGTYLFTNGPPISFNSETRSIASIWGGGVVVGDSVCEQVITAPAQGNADAGGNVTNITAPTEQSTPSCTPVTPHTTPYLNVYGGDVFAGGGFSTVGGCNQTADIKTNVRGNLGSGVQFAAYVMGIIDQSGGTNFITSQSTTGGPPSSLTFANTASPLGNFGGSSCIDDNTDTGTDVTGPPLDLTPLSTGTYSSSSALTLGTGGDMTISSGNQITLYVSGDLIIRRNIKYSWVGNSLTDIPSLRVIVTGGNLYVDHSVSRLDGIFVVAPRGSTGGTIYTCTNGGTPELPSSPSYFSDCVNLSSQLVVHGKLLANKIRWLRGTGDVNGPISTNDNPYGYSPSTGAAEVIIDGPESYIRGGNGGSSGGVYDKVTSLPPIL